MPALGAVHCPPATPAPLTCPFFSEKGDKGEPVDVDQARGGADNCHSMKHIGRIKKKMLYFTQQKHSAIREEVKVLLVKIMGGSAASK